MKRCVFILLLVLLVSPKVCSQESFPDVPKDHWAYESIDNLAKLGIIEGIPAEKGKRLFKGNTPLTRYQFAVALNKTIKVLGAKGITTRQIDIIQEPTSLQLESQIIEELKQGVIDLNQRVSVTEMDIKKIEQKIKEIEKPTQKKDATWWFARISLIISVAALVIAM